MKWFAYFDDSHTIDFMLLTLFSFTEFPGFILNPPYEGVETVYLSTKAPPGSPNNTVYHVLLCLAINNNHSDPLALPPATVFLDPMGNVIPFYPDTTDKNGKPTSDFYYTNLYLDEG